MEEIQTFRCVEHPIHMQRAAINKFTEYAADMTIALLYHKCRDDWNDEKKHISRAYGNVFEKHYGEVKKKYPRQCNNIEKRIVQLSEIEKIHYPYQMKQSTVMADCFRRSLCFWDGISVCRRGLPVINGSDGEILHELFRTAVFLYVL